MCPGAAYAFALTVVFAALGALFLTAAFWMAVFLTAAFFAAFVGVATAFRTRVTQVFCRAMGLSPMPRRI